MVTKIVLFFSFFIKNKWGGGKYGNLYILICQGL